MATQKVTTPVFRASYAYIFRPRPARQQAGQPLAEPKYSVAMLFPPGENLSALYAIANEAIAEKWGPDPSRWPTNLRSPFRDQGEKRDSEGYVPGAIFISASAKEAPQVVDRNLQPVLDPQAVYSGCYMRATVVAFAYDNNGNRGVSFGLHNLQLVGDGPRLAGRANATDDFDAFGDPSYQMTAPAAPQGFGAPLGGGLGPPPTGPGYGAPQPAPAPGYGQPAPQGFPPSAPAAPGFGAPQPAPAWPQQPGPAPGYGQPAPQAPAWPQQAPPAGPQPMPASTQPPGAWPTPAGAGGNTNGVFGR